MPSLKEIKNRISSVNNTRKITSAMKMVASSKLHHAQVMIENMLPYETMLEHILKRFLAAEAEAHTIYNLERPVKRVALIVFASNSSLCGGFNANVIKMMTQAIEQYRSLGMDNIIVYPIGRKVADKAIGNGIGNEGNRIASWYDSLRREYNSSSRDNVWVLTVTGYDPYDLSLTGRTLSYVLADILNVTEVSLDKMIPNKGHITVEEWNEILDNVYKKNKIYLGLNRVV